jgi:hypothetical protein
MRESYRKGVANHPGPEPCEGGREAALEALDRGIYRLGMELRKRKCGRPTVSPQPEGNKAACDKQVRRAPAESKTPGMYRNSTRENREAQLPPVIGRWRAGGGKR